MRAVTVYRLDDSSNYSYQTGHPIGSVFELMPAGNEGFEYHILALALALAVMVRGAGPVSFDRVLSGKR